jgi:hypothetical protein
MSLNAGSDEITSEDHVPNGTYWYHVDRLARQLATAIVEEELGSTSIASGRRLLILLDDGNAKNTSTTIVLEQVKLLWRVLSGIELKDSDPLFSDFVALWTASKNGGTTADDIERAWRTLLTAMLSHPDFISY